VVSCTKALPGSASGQAVLFPSEIIPAPNHFFSLTNPTSEISILAHVHMGANAYF